jgi:uncharacterized protein
MIALDAAVLVCALNHEHALREPCQRLVAAVVEGRVAPASPGARETELALGVRLFEEHPTLGAFDAVLAAAAMLSGADALVSADRAFAGIRGQTWMDPAGPAPRDLLAG